LCALLEDVAGASSGLCALLEDVAGASSGLCALLEDVAGASSGLCALLEDVAGASSGLCALLEDVSSATGLCALLEHVSSAGVEAGWGLGLSADDYGRDGLGRRCSTCRADRADSAGHRRDQARHADQAGNSLANASHHGGFLACGSGFELACISHRHVLGITAA
ncbi:hypothetical protein, partial [Streptomyces sp. NPDC102437]|uniref:hypothetical protein n=1 Tax=Streptomyces sp. NPDC102437 TaxID=3366175 RepID=UPI00381D0C04